MVIWFVNIGVVEEVDHFVVLGERWSGIETPLTHPLTSSVLYLCFLEILLSSQKKRVVGLSVSVVNQERQSVRNSLWIIINILMGTFLCQDNLHSTCRW